jgi:sugar O-acyltransferase (sialic acid O-acetyltransferase NeuD family)
MRKKYPVVIIGGSLFAEIAYEYFTYDSEYEVVAFAVESDFRKQDSLLGRPVVDFEEVQEIYLPSEHHFYAAIVYTDMNRVRQRLFHEAKAKGYSAASYVSSKAFVWENSIIGEHCFVFENNVVQPFVKIGNNVVLWSGNHIGHHGLIHDHCFVSSHVVISGCCTVGENCFVGVNSTIVQGVTIGRECLIGAAALVLGDVGDGQKVVGVWKSAPRSTSKEEQ